LASGPAAPAATKEPDWLTERRRNGAALASELALPTQKDKGWEFTDLSGLDLDAYRPGEVRVEGLVPGVDSADGPPVVLPLREAAGRLGDLVRERFGSLVPADDPFVARNEALWDQGVLVYVPRGQRLSEPLRLEIVQGADGAGVDWRALIVLEDDSEAEIWERYGAESDDAEGLFNGVVELVVGAGARLRYVCEQELSEQSWVFATQRAELARDASLEWVALGFGSARGKVRMETKLAGEGSSAKVTGAYLGSGSQHLDFDTTQEHAAKHTTSDLAFRGVLSDRATAVWRGMIRVDPGAQGTDAFQESRNLLLSKHAHADAIPGLEIEANDVRCTHAAAVAQVDRDQLYYLRSRGLPEPQAKRLIIDGFLQELSERTPEGPVRERLSAALDERLGEVLD
jgi:Fe-S cluster assembly protein SufD